MKQASILLSGLLLLTNCTAQEETISQQDIQKTKGNPVQKSKSKYGELTNEDEQNKLSIALVMNAIIPTPEFSTLEIINEGNQTYLASPEYTIEKFEDGGWLEVPFPKDTLLEGRTEFVGRGGGYYNQVNNEMLEKMMSEEGKYRLVKVLKAKEKSQEDVVLAHIMTIGRKK